MMLLFDESKKLEEALGSKGAAVIAHILERQEAERTKREEELLATKQDIALIQKDIKAIEATLQRDIAALDAGLHKDIKELEARLKYDLILRLGGIMAASVGIMAAVVKMLG